MRWAGTSWALALAGLAAGGAAWAAAGLVQAGQLVIEHLVFERCFHGLEAARCRRLRPLAPASGETVPARPPGTLLRIVHLSDLHLHRGPGAAHRTAMSATSAARPDLVVVTGDFVDWGSRFPPLRRYLADLARIAPAAAVLGNHDHEHPSRLAMVRRALSEAGIALLENRRAIWDGSESPLEVVGVDSPDLGLDDLEQALSRLPEKLVGAGQRRGQDAGGEQAAGERTGRGSAAQDAPLRITIAHSYHVLERPAAGRCGALVLVGDTHGGQVVLPWLGAVWATRVHRHRYVAGLYRVGGTWLYVNRGVGTIGPPVRWRCPPEIAVIDVTAPLQGG